MQLPVKISYRGLEKSDKVDDLVLEYAARLEKFCDHINRCDVAIEQPNHAHHKGNQFRVRIDVTVARVDAQRGRVDLLAAVPDQPRG